MIGQIVAETRHLFSFMVSANVDNINNSHCKTLGEFTRSVLVLRLG